MPETKAVSFADNGSAFADQLLDIINPLQHIPIVSTVYRALTGDEIAGPARLIGGALFGGPIGFAAATANLVLEQATGNDLAGHALALAGEAVEPPGISAASTPVAAFAMPVQAGERADTPALQQETAQKAAAPTAQHPPAATDGAAIVWNAPRILPSLARATPSQPEPVTTASAPSEPAWMGAAIADAQAVQEATQQGHATQRVVGQPWVSDAMLDALDKYEALSRARNQ